MLARTKNNYITTEGLVWLQSIGTENLCGFSSFEAPLECLLRKNLIPRDNNFASWYTHALECNANKQNARYQRANAIKSAFANCVLHDKSGESPFDQIISMVFDAYMDPERNPLSDYAEFIRDYMREKEADIQAAYNEYLKHRTEFVAINNRDDEFYNYMSERHPRLIEEMKQKYCAGIIAPNNEYRAREIDLIYIAKQLECFKTLVIRNLNAEPVPNIINERGNLEIHLRNTGNHWEAARLTVDTLELNPAEDVSKMLARTTDVQNKHALLIVFGARLINQYKFSQLLADDNSEVARIAQQGNDYIARAQRANELLDSNSPDSIAEVMRIFPR